MYPNLSITVRGLTFFLLAFLLFHAGCSDSNAPTGDLNDGGDAAGSNDTTDGSLDTGDTEGTPCTDPADCDQAYFCKTDADCDFLLEALPECSTALCETNTNTCSIHEDPTPGCKEEKPGNTICEITGAAGEVVTCTLEVVRTHADVPGPTFLTGDLYYPASLITFVGLSDHPCDDDTCDPVPVPPGTLHPSGHTVTLNPPEITDWDGVGVFSLESPADDPHSFITQAYLGATGSVAGDPRVIEIQFQLNIPILTPVWVTLANPTPQGLVGSTLSAQVIDHQVIVDGAAVEITCDPETDPDCEPPAPPEGLICTLTGGAGLQITCPISLIRASLNSALPVTLNTTLNYDPNKIKLTGFVQGTTAIPPGVLISGHALATNPTAPSSWDGDVSLFVQAPQGDPVPLTDIYMTATGPNANATLFSALFTMNSTVSDGNPAYVSLSKTSSTGGEGIALSTQIEDLRIVVDGPEQCPFADNCEEEPPPIPIPAGSLCAFVGNAGDELSCPLLLAKGDASYPPATAIQFVLHYDTALFALTSFSDELCVDGVGCFDVAVVGTGAQPLSTGHIVSAAPFNVAEWDGLVACIIAFGITEGITEAYLDITGAVNGDPLFMNAHVTLAQDIPADTPAVIDVSDMLGSTSDALSLEMVIIDSMMVTGAP